MYSTIFCFYLAYLYAEIEFAVQKTDKFIINGMPGSVDSNTGHIQVHLNKLECRVKVNLFQ